MKTSSSKPPGAKSPGAQRQEAYRLRQQAAGKRQMMIWVHEKSRRAGIKAGAVGAPSILPPEADVDGLSWFVGWIEGKAKLR